MNEPIDFFNVRKYKSTNEKFPWLDYAFSISKLIIICDQLSSNQGLFHFESKVGPYIEDPSHPCVLENIMRDDAYV